MRKREIVKERRSLCDEVAQQGSYRFYKITGELFQEMQWEIERLSIKIVQAKSEAYEEAAKVVERHGNEEMSDSLQLMISDLADKIRALKEKK